MLQMGKERTTDSLSWDLVIGESKRGGALVLTSLNIKLGTNASLFIVKASVEPS